MFAAPQQVGHLASSLDVWVRRTVVQQVMLMQRHADQLGRGPWQRRTGQFGTLGLTQRAPKTPHPHAVHAAKRRGQQELRLVGTRRATPSGNLHSEQERTRRRVSGQGDLVTGHFDRDTSRDQRSAECRDRGAPGANQDRHVTPGQIVAEVRAAQNVCDVLGFST
jgi:hypothetical protein